MAKRKDTGEKIKKAIIGGSGYDPRKMLETPKVVNVQTPYGDIDVTIGYLNGEKIAAINRHRDGYSIPAHKINHKANIFALWLLGVDTILATNAVGSLNLQIKPSHVVFANQFAHFGAPPITFFEGGEAGVYYTDITEPYCGEIRKRLWETAENMKIEFRPGGRYICTTGPQFETGLEILCYKKMGFDVVGMTSPPEAKLARELCICYQPICVVANYAAGLTSQRLTPKKVIKMMASKGPILDELISKTLKNVAPIRNCDCQKTKNPITDLWGWYEKWKNGEMIGCVLS